MTVIVDMNGVEILPGDKIIHVYTSGRSWGLAFLTVAKTEENPKATWVCCFTSCYSGVSPMFLKNGTPNFKRVAPHNSMVVYRADGAPVFPKSIFNDYSHLYT